MSILVAYATKHGATQGIAERIAAKLVTLGQHAQARTVESVGELTGYDAFVIGSATYMGAWLKEATEFVRHNQPVLATRPVWLFSSGPLGTATTDPQGRDLLTVSEPKEFAGFATSIRPRSTQVFFGALDPHKLGLPERMVRGLPSGHTLLPEGDFRDWQTIDAWAESIAHDLAHLPAAQP